MIYRCHRDLAGHRGAALSALPIIYSEILTWADEHGVCAAEDREYLTIGVRTADHALLEFLAELAKKD